ncbi:MAG TPA: hypothetical protein VGF40_00570, partial [Thermoanaerobaculia bacterium]
VVAGRMLHLGPLPIVAAIRSSLIAGAVMVGLLLIVRSAVGSLGAPLQLAALTVAGAAAYAATLWIIDAASVRQVIALFARRRPAEIEVAAK